MKKIFTIMCMAFSMLLTENALAQCAPQGRGNNNGSRFLLNNYASQTARDAALAQIDSIQVGGIDYQIEAHPNVNTRIRTTPLQTNGTFANPFTGRILLHLSAGGRKACIFNASTLPVELTSFQSKAISNGIRLSWDTASEENNDGFEVQRSIDGLNFESVHWEKGAGSTDQAQSYSYDDQNLAPGSYFYRLRQIDLDGAAAFSKIIIGDLSGYSQKSVYPSLVAKGGSVNVFSSQLERFAVYNQTGVVVQDVENSNTIETSGLSSGMYFVRFKDGSVSKFIVQ